MEPSSVPEQSLRMAHPTTTGSVLHTGEEAFQQPVVSRINLPSHGEALMTFPP